MGTDAIHRAKIHFEALLATMRRLRHPQTGCPWDLLQSHESLQYALLEESYEAMEALASGDAGSMVEELGDLLIQVVFHAQIGADASSFDIVDIVRQANSKLVRRHPHVFGDEVAGTAADIRERWDEIKAQERVALGEEQRSRLDGIPKSLPALAYAQTVQDRAARAGVVAELPGDDLGSRLFALVAEARQLGVQAEEELRGANRRYYEYFVALEQGAACSDASPSRPPPGSHEGAQKQAADGVGPN